MRVLHICFLRQRVRQPRHIRLFVRVRRGRGPHFLRRVGGLCVAERPRGHAGHRGRRRVIRRQLSPQPLRIVHDAVPVRVIRRFEHVARSATIRAIMDGCSVRALRIGDGDSRNLAGLAHIHGGRNAIRASRARFAGRACRTRVAFGQHEIKHISRIGPCKSRACLAGGFRSYNRTNGDGRACPIRPGRASNS